MNLKSLRVRIEDEKDGSEKSTGWAAYGIDIDLDPTTEQFKPKIIGPSDERATIKNILKAIYS